MEEEIVIDIKYVNSGAEWMILIDSGTPKSIVSSRWLNGYLRDAKVSDEDVKRTSCARHFKLGKRVYVSGVEVEFPMVLKMDENDFVKRRITANVIESDEVNFLFGKETIKEWRTKVDFEDDRLKFKGKDKSIELAKSEGAI